MNDLTFRITQNYDNLTPSARKIADHLRIHYAQAQYLSISDLATECGVAEATIFRFCRSLGFSGYNELRLAMAKDELKRMGLGKRANHKPTEMSGGQQQRVGIARAFVAKPKVIFADEPTGNLDSSTTRQVLYRMLNMAKDNGITFVMVTHERDLSGCADRVITIKDGRVESDHLVNEQEKAANQAALFKDILETQQEAPPEPETSVPANSIKD